MGYKFDGSVSTETHSIEYVAKHFLAWREKKKNADATRARVAAERKDREVVEADCGYTKEPAPKKERAGRRFSNKNGDLRAKAFAMFAEGAGAGDVAKEFEITYANAHYYLRAYRKGAK